MKKYDEVEDIEELKYRIKETLEIIYENAFDIERKYIVDDLWIEIEDIVRMLEWGKD